MSRASHPAQAQPSEPPFEQSLAELEGIVDALERGELSLEDSLAAFERGVGLTRTCQQALERAEQRVRILADGRAGAEPEPFVAPAGTAK
jgi:exodeoxyribonuclease VII small subunit